LNLFPDHAGNCVTAATATADNFDFGWTSDKTCFCHLPSSFAFGVFYSSIA